MRTAENIMQTLRDLWTIEDVCERLSRTPVTIATWRRERNLPTVIIPGSLRPTIRFVPEEVTAWAKENGIRIMIPRRPLLKRAA